MKIDPRTVLTIVLLLGGCASPQPQAASKQQAAAVPATAVADADQPDAQGKKRKCSNQTGSRLAPCGEGATGDYVAGASGDSYRNDMMGKYVGPVKPQ